MSTVSSPPSIRDRLCAKAKGLWTKKTLGGVVAGQFAAVLIASTSITSYELANRGINAPTSQSFFNYVLLAIFYGFFVIRRQQPLQINWYFYVVLSIIDVEANFLVVKGYQYTSITSVMLLSCWTIPCVIFLTWLFLKTKYGIVKIIGAGICVAGLVLVVFSDVHSRDRAKGSNPVKGDLIVIAGATLYAVSNVSEEFIVKKGDRIELMAMLGSFGAVVSACQISILEHNELRSIHWTAGAIYGATLLNLSLLTSDMWGILIRIFAYHQKVDWMYFVAYATVALGILIYSGGDKDDNRAQVAQASEKAKDEETVVVGLTQESSVAPSRDIREQISATVFS